MCIKRTKSIPRVVHSEVDVKFWAESLPSVARARPAQCPCCSAPSQPVGHPLGLVGHGTRERQVRGPLAPGAGTTQSVIRVRRYRCRICGAVITVVPRGVARGRHFGAGAIATALHSWGLERRPLDEVRRAVGGQDVECRGWPAARRWVDAVQAGRLFGGHVRPCPPGWPRSRIAERAATTLLGLGRPVADSADPQVQLFAGAALAA
jgi:hypothetical protein